MRGLLVVTGKQQSRFYQDVLNCLFIKTLADFQAECLRQYQKLAPLTYPIPVEACPFEDTLIDCGAYIFKAAYAVCLKESAYLGKYGAFVAVSITAKGFHPGGRHLGSMINSDARMRAGHVAMRTAQWSGNKKPASVYSCGFLYSFGLLRTLNWWRRRESNPRPQVLYSQFYILSHVI